MPRNKFLIWNTASHVTNLQTKSPNDIYMESLRTAMDEYAKATTKAEKDKWEASRNHWIKLLGLNQSQGQPQDQPQNHPTEQKSFRP
jgi:hypothetical protein